MATLNPEFDRLLLQLGAPGPAMDPRCENCGADLTDAAVHALKNCWVGDCCRNEPEPIRFDAEASIADFERRKAEVPSTSHLSGEDYFAEMRHRYAMERVGLSNGRIVNPNTEEPSS